MGEGAELLKKKKVLTVDSLHWHQFARLYNCLPTALSSQVWSFVVERQMSSGLKILGKR